MQRVATVAKLELEPGWPVFAAHVQFGDRYLVDLDQVKPATLVNATLGKQRDVQAVYGDRPARPRMASA